jgi:hypothetical protein
MCALLSCRPKSAERTDSNSVSDDSPSNIPTPRSADREIKTVSDNGSGSKAGSDVRESRFNLIEAERVKLFSIEISAEASKDREAAWNFLELDSNRNRNSFHGDQFRFAGEMLEKYMEAPQLEKLVMWKVVELRIESFSENLLGGAGANLEIVKIQKAKLLLSAFGLDDRNLFHAADYKVRYSGGNSAKEGNEADEKIDAMYATQSKVADQILEKHWKISP